MAIESFIITQDFKSPVVRVTGRPEKPQQVTFKSFRKGDIVKGELKHANNKPAFVLVGGQLVIPVSVIKKVVTKDITSNADGEKPKSEMSKAVGDIVPKRSTLKYVDAIVIGGALGIGGAYLAEKQGWIEGGDNKTKLYGALIGAGIGVYLLYRLKVAETAPKPKKITEE
jgi:hypothetical protein